MSATNTLENALLSLLFENTDFVSAPLLRGATTPGSFHISLHTADPGEAGSQTTSETAYTNYARQAVARSTVGWTVATGTVTNDAPITFPTSGVTGSTITHFGIGELLTTAGNLYLKGALTSPLVISGAGITPSFAIGQLSVSLD